MQIVNQHTQVNHQLIQHRQREVSISSDANALRTANQNQPQTSEQASEFEITLTPKQKLQKMLVDNLSSPHPAHNIEHVLNEVFYRHQSTLSPEQRATSNQTTQLHVAEHICEYENLNYQTQLNIEDQSGTTQDLTFSFEYLREVSINRELTLSLGQFKDPLIVNLDNTGQLLGRRNMNFDLDADGQQESIPELNSGVWYLAHDINKNGQVDDGSELFGALTGEGFTQLRGLDSNRNGIIEETDDEFQHLSLWRKNQALYSLSDSPIAAISLNAQNTSFTFTDNQAHPVAALRQTAVYVTQNHTLGAVHQIDFVV